MASLLFQNIFKKVFYNLILLKRGIGIMYHFATYCIVLIHIMYNFDTLISDLK